MSMATDVVAAQIEAYRAKDVERFLSYYADDASVVLFDGTPMFADKQAMRTIRETVCQQPRPAPDCRQPDDRRGLGGRRGARVRHALR
jgi:hypothetical protein